MIRGSHMSICFYSRHQTRCYEHRSWDGKGIKHVWSHYEFSPLISVIACKTSKVTLSIITYVEFLRNVLRQSNNAS
jgi:hypothetical protein